MVCVSMWVPACHFTYVEVRGPLRGVSSLLPPQPWFQGKSSEGQAEPQAPLPPEPAEGREKFYSRTTQNDTISSV